MDAGRSDGTPGARVQIKLRKMRLQRIGDLRLIDVDRLAIAQAGCDVAGGVRVAKLGGPCNPGHPRLEVARQVVAYVQRQSQQVFGGAVIRERLLDGVENVVGDRTKRMDLHNHRSRP